MAINFSKEYAQFRAQLREKHELYDRLGMTQQQINALDQFDKEEFLSNNRYLLHSRPFTLVDEDFDDDMNPLLEKYLDVLSVQFEVTYHGEYAWLEDISSLKLHKLLLSLSQEDMELLDAYVFGEKTQSELAEEKGIAQQNISKRLNKIRRILSKAL